MKLRNIKEYFDLKVFLLFIFLSSISFPLFTLWHELGHFVAAKILGWKAFMGYAMVLTYPKDNPWAIFDTIFQCTKASLIIHSMGLIFTWTIIFISFILFLKFKKEFLLIGLQFAAIHIFYPGVSIYGKILRKVLPSEIMGIPDLTKVAQCFHFSPTIFSIGLWIVATGIFGVVISQLKKEHLFSIGLGSLLGSALGAIIWVFFLGPLLFPYPQIPIEDFLVIDA